MTVVYDIETLKSCFTYTAIDIKTKKQYVYVLHKDRFELKELINHLKECRGQIGFNNINFDYPIIHYILSNYKSFNYNNSIDLIYNKAQEIINNQDTDKKFNYQIIEKYWMINQLDLFKLWHFDNRARSTSLKSLQISMNYPNVMEIPISHDKSDILLEEIPLILEYNLNDVLATYEFYKKTVQLDKIELRKTIQTKYNLSCFNWSNGKIGEELILKLYCEKTGTNYWDIKKLRTNRDSINLSDCIPNNIKFKSGEFNKLLDFYSNTTITETKGSVNYSIIYKGIKYNYGTGGIHACIESGVYESTKEDIIKTCDVASLYPNLPIIYRFTIKHLGDIFLDIYAKEIVGKRLSEKAKPKAQQDKAIIDGYKEASNIPYGKSNDINSFLYDPLYSMKTTLAGQLVISMLCEKLAEIPNSQILMVNTDGLEIKINKKYEELYHSICNKWEKETKLVLEFDNYQKIWIRDINNYGCITFKGKIKNKGTFEVDKVIGNEPAYHKDNSFKIIPLAIQEYFVNNTSIHQTILNHKNIYDFCGRQKFTKDSYGETHEINYDLEGNLHYNIKKQQKNVRYYISNSKISFIKIYNKGTKEIINKKYNVTIFNKFEDKKWVNYDINYNFYIKECYKIIQSIQSKQLNLFI